MLENKYNITATEAKWQKYWQENGIYKYEKNSKKPTFSIDTPPPTVSGDLHIGSITGYAQADMFARFERMKGKNLFFPLGFDNNGLPTELLVEQKKKIKAHNMPREEFTKIALDLVDSYNQTYRNMMIHVGMSCDLSLEYNTIDSRSQKTSQKSFIELAKKGIAYREDKPSPWCCKCHTSVASLELEDKELDSTFNYLNFRLADGSGTICIATTRPEFLPACVAIFVNPEDARYQHIVDKKVKVPLFEENVVTVIADRRVGIDKGSGIVMCCTFGDQTDVEWWKEYKLPLKKAIDDNGRMTELAGKYSGMKIEEARRAVIDDLKAAGYMEKQVPITHTVKVHERCSLPIEFLSKKQWFIRTSTPELKQKWTELGEQIEWHPKHMKTRYMLWVNNLNQDWSISRQRYFGVPFPVWYCKQCGKPIFADEKDLPVNPLSSTPNQKCECGCSEFEPEYDIMDTWATSSVTPQINCNWAEDEKGCLEKLPMDLRTLGRDIITTWALRTIIKAWYHHQRLPWKRLAVNGWVMPEKGVKFSKHLSNAKTSVDQLLAQYGADVIRYWCAIGEYGRDVIFSDEGFKDGYKLLNKIWNASKFILSFLYDYAPKEPKTLLPMDRYIIHKFNESYEKTIEFYKNYEMGYAKNEIEKFFWNFCDNYIELVKRRLYNPDIYGQDAKESAQYACYHVLLSCLKLLAITMPHITEEIYQDYFIKYEKVKSIHLTVNHPIEIADENDIIKNGDNVIAIVSKIRQFKSENKLSLKTEIDRVVISDPDVDFLKSCAADLKAVCCVREIEFLTGDADIKIGNPIIEAK